MIKLSKLSVAVVFSLLLGLALFTTGAFAQSADQKIDRGHIRASARAVVVNTRGIQRPHGWGDGWEGDGGGFDGLRVAFHETVRCTSMRECRSVVECRWSRWGRACRSIRLCRKASVCHRCRTRVGWREAGWDNGWVVKH